jgi:hypothetical protein
MAFTRTFEYLSFDSNNAILYVRIRFFRDSVLYDNVGSFPIQLPVDSLGQVPIGAALTSYINQALDVVYSPESHQFRRNLADFGGAVSNASEIFALTIEDEPPVPLVRGIIYDEFDTPVEGASVQSLASGPLGAVTTNSLGEYLLPAFSNFESVLVTTGAASFEIWPRMQVTSIFGDTTLDITVRAADTYGTNVTITNADTEENTVVNTARSLDRAEVVLAAGSVVDSNGDPVSDVIVSIANSVVSDLNYASAFPGFFLGTSGPGTPFPIESFGFLEVLLLPVSGNEVLSLDPTKPATIRIPVFPNPVGVNTIPLWRLDEETGIWEETGAATRVGDTLVFEATVTSFSFYNLDRPLSGPVTLTVNAYNNTTLENFNAGPIPAAGVAITVDVLSPSNGALWQGRGVTDANGQLVLSVPGGFLNVFGRKGTDIYYGFSYDEGEGTASIDLFNFAPPFNPPAPPGEGFSVELIMAAGNNYSTPTTTLLVVDASNLFEFFSAEVGQWYPRFADEEALVVSITAGETFDTIELASAVVLIDDINAQGAGATIIFDTLSLGEGGDPGPIGP